MKSANEMDFLVNEIMNSNLKILLCSMLLFPVSACSNQSMAESSGTENSTDTAAQTDSQPAASLEDSAAADSASTKSDQPKTLVVYYSATNNTEQVAEYIADETGADLFELVPADPYTSEDLDWTNPESRVSLEHEDESLQNIELENVSPENWDDYETVFIGYPIWWGNAAWPVNGFITSNNFDGKTVIPFCTSASSGLGESGELLEQMAGSGTWLEGIRFPSGVDEESVTEWLSTLEY